MPQRKPEHITFVMRWGWIRTQTSRPYTVLLRVRQMFGYISPMIRQVNVSVSVGLLIDAERKLAAPKWVLWAGKRYAVTEVGFHHRRREGRKFWHVYHVKVGTLDMRLEIDGKALPASCGR